MSSVASVAGINTSTAATSTSTAATTAMSKDDFLKLLVTQLKHQDPLNPQDPSQFVSELAQFSQMGQLTNMSSSLGSLASATTSSQWISAIGKRASVSSTTLSPNDQAVISPQGAYDKVTLTLKNQSTGESTTKTMTSGDSLVYTNSGDSTYTVSATATKNGTAVGTMLTVLKRINGVSVSDTGTTLVFNDGTAIPSSSVKVVTE